MKSPLRPVVPRSGSQSFLRTAVAFGTPPSHYATASVSSIATSRQHSPVNSVENCPRASVVDGLRRIEPRYKACEFGVVAMWFEHGTLTYSCPETTRPVRTGIIADTATVEKLSFFKLSVWCPHCAAPHMTVAKDASIS